MRVPLIYRNKPVFGLDIGSHSAKLVQLKAGPKGAKVVGYGSASYAADAIVEGIISDPEPIAAAIKEALATPLAGSITARRVVAAIPIAKSFIRTLDLPVMSQADLEQAVRYEAEQYVPVPLSDLYLDHEVLGNRVNEEGEEHMEVLMAAAPRAIVDSYMKLFELAGLEVEAIESSLRAIMRAMRPIAPANKPVMMVDFGSRSTDLAVYDPAPRLTGTFAVGGDDLTTTLAKALNLKPDQALEIKHKFGIAGGDMQAKIFKALAPQLETVATEIKKAIKFYHERSNVDDEPPVKPGKKTAALKPAPPKPAAKPGTRPNIEVLILAGGSANMPGLGEYLKQEAGVPVVVGDPWMKLDLAGVPEPADTELIMYAPAIGLALREITP